MFSFLLITSLLENVSLLVGEIPFWSLLRVRGLNLFNMSKFYRFISFSGPVKQSISCWQERCNRKRRATRKNCRYRKKTFFCIIKTITKFSNVISYHQPNLSINRAVYASYVIGQCNRTVRGTVNTSCLYKWTERAVFSHFAALTVFFFF